MARGRSAAIAALLLGCCVALASGRGGGGGGGRGGGGGGAGGQQPSSSTGRGRAPPPPSGRGTPPPSAGSQESDTISDEELRQRDRKVAEAIRRNTEERDREAAEEKELFEAAAAQQQQAGGGGDTHPRTPPPTPATPPPGSDALTSLFRKSLVNLKANTAPSKPEPPAQADRTSPHWAASDPTGGNSVKAFAYGIIEELATTVKGRLPCPALPYLLSHYGWLVAYKAGGLVVDVGSNANSFAATRSLSATFPDREVLSVTTAGGGAQSAAELRLADNVKLNTEAGRLTSEIVSGSTELSLAVFSCTDATCVSAGLAALKPLLKPGSIVVFSRLLGYPQYLGGSVKVLFELFEASPALSFEVVGGRFLEPAGGLCVLHNPKSDACAGSVAVRIVAAGQGRLPGGHTLPATLPTIAPLCTGVGTPEEVLLRQHHALNTSFSGFKSSVDSKIMSLALNRESSARQEAKTIAELKKYDTRLQELESNASMLNMVVLMLSAVVVVLLHRIYVAQSRKSPWLK